MSLLVLVHGTSERLEVDANITYPHLVRTIRAKFGIDDDVVLSTKWIDEDDDQITMESDVEFLEAVQDALSRCAGTLNIVIAPPPPPPPQPVAAAEPGFLQRLFGGVTGAAAPPPIAQAAVQAQALVQAPGFPAVQQQQQAQGWGGPPPSGSRRSRTEQPAPKAIELPMGCPATSRTRSWR